MGYRSLLGTFVAAGSLALALAGFTAGSAGAAQQGGGFTSPVSCELNGYQWSDVTKSCADRSCTWFGGTFYPGESTTMKISGGGYATYWCDGFTGKMTPMPAKVSPQLPAPQPKPALRFY
jgi:hypothetical protein